MCSHEAVHAEAPLWWRDANNGFKVAAPQHGNLLLCEDDGWFYWFSSRECVPMTERSIRAWRWREVVDGVMVLQFWWCTLGWWLFCCIFLSKNSTKTLNDMSHQAIRRSIMVIGVDDVVQVGALFLDGLDSMPQDPLIITAINGIWMEESEPPSSIASAFDDRIWHIT